MSLTTHEINTSMNNEMAADKVTPIDRLWRFDNITWVIIALTLGVMIFAYFSGLQNLITRWDVEEEYNHGYYMPFVTLTFLWYLGPRIARESFKPSWFSILLSAGALLLLVVGELSAIYLFIHYSFVLLLMAVSLALIGWNGTRLTFAPIFILVFSIPIPYFLEAGITAKLQLISTILGVSIIKYCGIPVFRDGNLIDLGVYKLEVIEACSGLTYLYPLLGFGVICAYLFHTTAWKRVLLVFSTIPIAIFLNSFRIGMIGFLVKYFGNEQAEGFLHDFEGFAVFMMCVAILFLEIGLLTKVGKDRRPFAEVFGLTMEELPAVPEDKIMYRPLSKPLLANFALISCAAVIMSALEARTEITPSRAHFSEFPNTLNQWQGKRDVLGAEVLTTLDLTDYVMVDYKTTDQIPVNFYVAYYESQRKGSSPHSPSVCLPGGGWQILDMTRKTYPSTGNQPAFEYNRVVIGKGKARQLVYYWFDGRGRIIADEYQVKWHLFTDSIFKNRTDGALVRLITPIIDRENEAEADQRITSFLADALPLIPEYIPR